MNFNVHIFPSGCYTVSAIVHRAGNAAPLALTPQREFSVVHKAGGLPLAPGVLMGAIQVAAARAAREPEAWLDVCACTKTGR
jgi:hypothetical protein